MMHEHLRIHAWHIAKQPVHGPACDLFHAPVTLEVLGRLRFGKLVNLENCRLASEHVAIEETLLFRVAPSLTRPASALAATRRALPVSRARLGSTS
jgi:hypothetical protein